MLFRKHETRDDLVWVLIPVGANRTPSTYTRKNGEKIPGAGKTITLASSDGWAGEELYERNDEFGPVPSTQLLIDGQEAKLTYRLSIPNVNFVDLDAVENVGRKAKAIEQGKAEDAKNDAIVKAKADIVLERSYTLQNGMVLPQGTMVSQVQFADILAGKVPQ